MFYWLLEDIRTAEKWQTKSHFDSKSKARRDAFRVARTVDLGSSNFLRLYILSSSGVPVDECTFNLVFDSRGANPRVEVLDF